ncbi:hypothetical protein [Fluviicola taffensis]|uniref:Uncharacterized protein n=1 Tax=Fluviicola taffensis (strain DSM 16823 / NCIMB 13979 / RW262) TaxID=755732 RepID=F2IIG0_FLUTR|nr:hypothetical protein [Fluviicola taffensis]AEA44886.1 hypothetical protein Fluta_2907 [Fluviicola taffensis DSM 16823]
MITILFKYFWIAFIIITFVNAFIMRHRSKKYITEMPDLKDGYDKLFKGMIFYGNIPWVIMGFGIISGLSNNMFDYFNPKSMNSIVLVFHFSIIVLWVLSIRWIYFKSGAEFIENHPGFIQVQGFGNRNNISAKQIKLFYPLMLAVGIAGMIMMWIMDKPTLKL